MDSLGGWRARGTCGIYAFGAYDSNVFWEQAVGAGIIMASILEFSVG